MSQVSGPSFDEAMAKAQAVKEEANQLLKAGDFAKASSKYHYVYLHVGMFLGKGEEQMAAMTGGKASTKCSEEQKKLVVAILVASYNNLVLCKLNMGQLNRAIELSQKVLDLDPGNCKVRLRRCMAYLQLGDVDGAAEDLKFLQAKDPSLLEGTSLVTDLELKRTEMLNKEKKLFAGKMFA